MTSTTAAKARQVTFTGTCKLQRQVLVRHQAEGDPRLLPGRSLERLPQLHLGPHQVPRPARRPRPASRASPARAPVAALAGHAERLLHRQPDLRAGLGVHAGNGFTTARATSTRRWAIRSSTATSIRTSRRHVVVVARPRRARNRYADEGRQAGAEPARAARRRDRRRHADSRRGAAALAADGAGARTRQAERRRHAVRGVQSAGRQLRLALREHEPRPQVLLEPRLSVLHSGHRRPGGAAIRRSTLRTKIRTIRSRRLSTAVCRAT